MQSQYSQIIKKIYTNFNARDIDAIFTLMAPDVHWPKAFEGGYITGYDAVREYWIRQWSEINPRVEPTAITERPDGKIDVTVDQLVKDLEGNIIFNGTVKHIYVFKNELIFSMDVDAS